MSEVVLDGKIVSGVGAASRELLWQLPILAQYYEELRNAHPATINVDVSNPIDLKIDFKSYFIGNWPYLFRVEFVRVQFEFPLGTIPDAKSWIYQPYGYHWGELNRKSLVEILVSKHLDGIALGRRCRIHVLNNNLRSSSVSPHYLAHHAAIKNGKSETRSVS